MNEPSFKHNYKNSHNSGQKALSLKPMYRAIWNWEKCRDKILMLRGRLGFPDESDLKFLRLSLSLEDGQVFDELRDQTIPEIEASVYCILSGYSDATAVEETSRLVSFVQLLGGNAYQNAFNRRAVQPIERIFSSAPETLYKVAELLGATKLDYGDYSVKVYALPLVPVHVVLWSSSSEFPTSANILFDSSVNNYLSTEQTAMLGELAAARLKHAKETIT
jgi:hypothetical protein